MVTMEAYLHVVQKKEQKGEPVMLGRRMLLEEGCVV